MDEFRPDPFPPAPPAVGDARPALFRMASVGAVLAAAVVGLVVYGAWDRQSWGSGAGATGEAAAGGGLPGEAPWSSDSLSLAGLPHAELSVRVAPEGATVLIDGDSVGVAPLWQGLVLEGMRWLRVLTPDGEVVVDTMVQVDGSGLVLNLVSPSDAAPGFGAPPRLADAVPVDLRPPFPVPPAPPPPPVAVPAAPSAPATRPAARPAARPVGTVEVLVRPWGRIVIDGVALTQETDVVYRAELPAGTHRVEAVHATLGSASRTVTIRPGSRTRVEFDLAETPAPR